MGNARFMPTILPAEYLAVPDTVVECVEGLAQALRQDIEVHVRHAESAMEYHKGEAVITPGFWEIEGREHGILLVLWDSVIDNAEAARTDDVPDVVEERRLVERGEERACGKYFKAGSGRHYYCGRVLGHDGQHSI